MRDIKNDFSTAVYYAARDVRRKPKEALTITAITSAIILSLILLLLWLEADWRADVMPENEENYHFSVIGLSAGEKSIIKNKEWCAAVYEVPSSDRSYDTEFRVRIKWEYLDRYYDPMTEIFDSFGLKNREPYKRSYDGEYTRSYEKYKNAYHDKKDSLLSAQYITSDPAEAARSYAKLYIIDHYIKNDVFCVKTTQSYIVMPDNLITILLFTAFVAAAIFIITNERYRRSLPEVGSLRAVGFAKWQIYVYYAVRGIFITAAAMLPAALLSALSVALYGLLTKSMNDNGVYLTLAENVPFSNLFTVFLMIFISTAAANIIVCVRYGKYGVMDDLRGRETLEVGYVDISSYKFEHSESPLAYASLYSARTKKRLITNAASVALMAPLPVFYITGLSIMTGEISALENSLFIFQAILLTLASVIIISLSVIYSIRGRRSEISMLRAMGMPKQTIAKSIAISTLAESAIATIIASVLSSFIILYMNQSMSVPFDPESQSTGTAIEFVIDMILGAPRCIIPASLIIILSELLGAALGLFIYARGSIIEGIRRAD